MDYNQIYYEYEVKYYSINNAILKKFIEEFRSKSGLDERNFLATFGVSPDNPMDVFTFLLNFLITYKPKYIGLFYQLLGEFNYNIGLDISSYMKVIGNYGICDVIPEDMYSFIIKSPFINSIGNNQGLVTFSTSQFGDLSFYSTAKYFQDDSFARQFLRSTDVSRKCHTVSWQLLNYLNDANLVTALIPNYFEGTYYHTIIRNQDGMFIDSASALVYDEAIFENLFRGEIIAETNKDDIKDAYQEALNDDEASEEFEPALALALHKQKKSFGRK